MRCKPWQFPAGRQVRNTRFVFVLQFRTQFHSTIGSFLTKPKLSQQQTAFWWVQYRDQRARSGIRSIEPLGLSWSFLSSLAYGELKRTNGNVDRAPANNASISKRTVGGFGPTFCSCIYLRVEECLIQHVSAAICGEYPNSSLSPSH